MGVMRAAFLLSAILLVPPPATAESHLGGKAQALFEQARSESRWFRDALELNPEIVPTSDGRSFMLVWRASRTPQMWIASLHGAGRPARGFATDDLAVWAPHLRGRDVGIVCLQWWLGTGDAPRDFLDPKGIAEELSRELARLHVAQRHAMLHGFSRGSANLYAIAATARAMGTHPYSMFVANGGGMSPDYPPNMAIERGEFGRAPLKDTRWITVAGEQDPNPDRDGISGMRRTARWLVSQGAEVLFAIEDPGSGHGALHRNPRNTSRVLDAFLGQRSAE